MIKIGICDNEKKELDSASKHIEAYFNSDLTLQGNYVLMEFLSPMDLLDYLSEKGSFDILFLDIYMPGILGIEVASEIRKRGDDTKIIFLTSSKEHALDAFSLHASDYLVKPINQEKLFETLSYIVSQMKIEEQLIFSIKTKEGITVIPIREITYVELEGRCALIHKKNEEIIESLTLRTPFDEFIDPLTENTRFIRIHKSYLVNMFYIDTIKGSEFFMRDGNVLPIARRFYSSVKKTYMSFLLKGGM